MTTLYKQQQQQQQVSKEKQKYPAEKKMIFREPDKMLVP